MAAMMYRYWRGGVNYRILFFTSPLVSAQFSIFAVNTMGGLVPTTITNLEQTFRKTVTVSGYQVVDLYVPAYSTCPWIPVVEPWTNNVYTQVYLRCDVLPRQVGDNVSYVDAMICVSGGADMQFQSLRSPQGKKTVQAQMNLRSEWPQHFESLTGGVPALLRPIYEDTVTLEEISLRYSNRVPLKTEMGLLDVESTDFRSLDVFDWINSMFHYSRGSVRCKLYSDGVTGVPYVLQDPIMSISQPDNALWAGNGISYSEGQGGIFDIEIPYLNIHDWVVPLLQGKDLSIATRFTFVGYPTPVITNLLSPPTKLWVAAGRDYQIQHLRPPRTRAWFPQM
jgi:hypothetical protein